MYYIFSPSDLPLCPPNAISSHVGVLHLSDVSCVSRYSISDVNDAYTFIASDWQPFFDPVFEK